MQCIEVSKLIIYLLICKVHKRLRFFYPISIISLRRFVPGQKTGLTPPILLKWLYQAIQVERSCILYVSGVDLTSFYHFSFGFWKCFVPIIFSIFLDVLFSLM
jgi:hypothetical protein